MQPKYAPESAGSVMTTAVPTCKPTSTRQEVVANLVGNLWEDLHYIYVVDDRTKLLGWVRIVELVQLAIDADIKSITRPVTAQLAPSDDQEMAVFLAVKNDLDEVPVIDDHGRLLGAVVARSIIDIMHNEHVEDALLSVGIRRGKGMNLVKLAQSRLLPVIFTRAPWLIVGGIVGVALGFVASWFESSLQETIALAFFVPVVAYAADSVGTQSEAITVRALATLKLSLGVYLVREVAIGFSLGTVLGVLGGIGAWLVTGAADMGLVVGISLLAASTLASALASLIPITFKSLGKDPALGSGPLATALQDIISIIVYFLVAMLIL